MIQARHLGLVVAVGAVVGFLSSCGSDKDYTGSAGSCTTVISEDLGMTMCVDYAYKATAEKDPAADVKTEIETSCGESTGSTYSTEACSTTGSVGTCAFSATSTKATVTATAVYTGSGMTKSTAETSCAASSGTFTPA